VFISLNGRTVDLVDVATLYFRCLRRGHGGLVLIHGVRTYPDGREDEDRFYLIHADASCPDCARLLAKEPIEVSRGGETVHIEAPWFLRSSIGGILSVDNPGIFDRTHFVECDGYTRLYLTEPSCSSRIEDLIDPEVVERVWAIARRDGGEISPEGEALAESLAVAIEEANGHDPEPAPAVSWPDNEFDQHGWPTRYIELNETDVEAKCVLCGDEFLASGQTAVRFKTSGWEAKCPECRRQEQRGASPWPQGWLEPEKVYEVPCSRPGCRQIAQMKGSLILKLRRTDAVPFCQHCLDLYKQGAEFCPNAGIDPHCFGWRLPHPSGKGHYQFCKACADKARATGGEGVTDPGEVSAPTTPATEGRPAPAMISNAITA